MELDVYFFLPLYCELLKSRNYIFEFLHFKVMGGATSPLRQQQSPETVARITELRPIKCSEEALHLRFNKC